MKKILATGATGLIGSALLQRLRTVHFKVISCAIRLRDNNLSFFSNELKLLLTGYGVMHIAYIAGVIEAKIYQALCQKINIENIAKLLDLFKSALNKPWFVQVSTSRREVTEEQEALTLIEPFDLNPINNYTKVKILIKKIIINLQNFNFNIAILRFSNVYGILLYRHTRVAALCISTFKRRTIKVECGGCIFLFKYFLKGLIYGLTLPANHLQNIKLLLLPIYFTTYNPCSLKNLRNILLKLTKSNFKVNFYPPRNFGINSFYGDFIRAKKNLVAIQNIY